jgi:hypothetical protein
VKSCFAEGVVWKQIIRRSLREERENRSLDRFSEIKIASRAGISIVLVTITVFVAVIDDMI